MHVTRSSKSLEKYKIMQKLLSDPMTTHNNPQWRVINPHDPTKSLQVCIRMSVRLCVKSFYQRCSKWLVPWPGSIYLPPILIPSNLQQMTNFDVNAINQLLPKLSVLVEILNHQSSAFKKLNVNFCPVMWKWTSEMRRVTIHKSAHRSTALLCISWRVSSRTFIFT